MSAAPPTAPPARLIVAITGASGAVYGIRLLEKLRAFVAIETHLIVSPAGWLTIHAETSLTREGVEALADVVHSPKAIGACIASGSFRTLGMVIAPCSMRTLAGIATGVADNLIGRAADVVLKERRPLVLLARETPLHLGHLRNMVAVTEMGGIVLPPVPAFYHRPQTIDDIVDETVARLLERFDLHDGRRIEWQGL
ncbi:MAG: UbiX family flavin prenyltransferase [Burkholderiaceae bacterium]